MKGVNDFYEYRPNYNSKPKNPLVPNCGISITISLLSIIFWLIPSISLPKIIAYFFSFSGLKLSSFIDLFACSTAII